MFIAALANGFRLSWHGDTARIDLPPLEIVGENAYEPVLSQRDAERVATAIDVHEQKRRRSGASQVLAHVRLARDTRYARATLAKFRGRLSVALVERGHDVSIDEKTTMTGTGQLAGAGV